MRRPRLRADYQAVPVTDHLVIIGEERNLLIEDPAAAALAPLLDGTRTAGDLVAALAGRHQVRAVTAVLRRLEALGLLADGPAPTGVAATAGWDAYELDPAAAEEWSRTGRVLLVDAGSPALPGFAAALGPRTEVLTVDDDRLRHGDDPVVVLPGTLLDPRLAALNRLFLDLGRSWTLARPHGSVLLLGPHLIPGETGCWECLRQRWADNEQVESYLASRSGGADRPSAARAVLPATTLAAAGLLAADLPVLALRGRSPRLTGRMVTVDTRDLSTRTHRLIRQPQCPACGDPDLTRKADPRITLTGGVPGWTEGGTRLRSTMDTYRLLEKHVSRYLGVVTRLDALEDEDGLTHSYLSGHNFAVARHPVGLRKSLRGLSGGKGRTALQAKVSAIGEAIERYSAVWRDDRPVHRASWAQLGADRAVHPRDLLLFSDRQYRERDRTNGGAGHFHQVPAPLGDHVELDWTTAWSLTHERPREIPAAYCWYGHPEIGTLGVCGPDSNGCAAGGTIDEAILQGFGELVERDAVALWWYHRSRLPGVDLDAFDDPWITALRRHYADALDRDLWVLDLTADLGIPVYAAISRHRGRPTEDVIVGFGAHLDAAVALGRALTELNQFLPIVSRFLDGSTRYGIADPEMVRWYRTVRVADQPWLTPDPSRPPTGPLTHPGLMKTTDIADAVRRCVRRAAAAGLEVIVLDQSRPELELPVVKVLVPGLRHFWRRLGPGRLYDVPRALGRAPLAADEDGINPLSVFF